MKTAHIKKIIAVACFGALAFTLALAPNARAADALTSAAVSYTHLTLPTILLV